MILGYVFVELFVPWQMCWPPHVMPKPNDQYALGDLRMAT